MYRKSFIVLVWLWAFPCMADVVPCVKKHEGRWRVDLNEKCIQYTQIQGLRIAENQKLLSSLKLEIGALKLQLENKNLILKEWDMRALSWQTQMKFMQEKLKETEKQAELWKVTALELKKMKVVEPPWYKSPILWAVVGLAAGIGLTYLAAQAIKPSVISTQKLSTPQILLGVQPFRVVFH